MTILHHEDLPRSGTFDVHAFQCPAKTPNRICMPRHAPLYPVRNATTREPLLVTHGQCWRSPPIFQLPHSPLVFSGSIWFSGSSPVRSFTGSNAGFPPYNCPPLPFAPVIFWPCPGPPPSSSWLTLMGWLPRKRLRMSTMPRLHWPNPRLSCWHCVGRVSSRGGERHSRGVWRETRMHSEFWRHCASAAPFRWESVGESEGGE